MIVDIAVQLDLHNPKHTNGRLLKSHRCPTAPRSVANVSEYLNMDGAFGCPGGTGYVDLRIAAADRAAG